MHFEIILLLMLFLWLITHSIAKQREYSLDFRDDLEDLLGGIDLDQIPLEEGFGPSSYDLMKDKINLNVDLKGNKRRLILLHKYFLYEFHSKKPIFKPLKVFAGLGYRVSFGILGLGAIAFFFTGSSGLLGPLIIISALALALSIFRYLLNLITELWVASAFKAYIKKRVEEDKKEINDYITFSFLKQMLAWAVYPWVIYAFLMIFISFS